MNLVDGRTRLMPYLDLFNMRELKVALIGSSSNNNNNNNYYYYYYYYYHHHHHCYGNFLFPTNTSLHNDTHHSQLGKMGKFTN